MSPKEITNSELKILNNPLDALENNTLGHQFDIQSKATKLLNSWQSKNALEGTEKPKNSTDLLEEDVSLEEEDVH